MSEPSSTQQPRVQFAEGCSPVCDVVRRPRRRRRKSRPWHRVLGMITALPLIWVLVTGVLLNHQEDFGFHEKEITSPMVLASYGMQPNGEALSADLGNLKLTQWDGQLFLGSERVELSGDFCGAVATDSGFAIATDQAVVLYTAEGEVIEKLDELSLPTLPLLGIGKQVAQVCVQNAEGWHAADADWLEFTPTTVSKTESVQFAPLTDIALKKQLATAWAGGGLPLSRVILDLHAGNFLGDFAKYFYDVVVLCALWLIGTGIVIQYRTSRRTKPNC